PLPSRCLADPRCVPRRLRSGYCTPQAGARLSTDQEQGLVRTDPAAHASDCSVGLPHDASARSAAASTFSVHLDRSRLVPAVLPCRYSRRARLVWLRSGPTTESMGRAAGEPDHRARVGSMARSSSTAGWPRTRLDRMVVCRHPGYTRSAHLALQQHWQERVRRRAVPCNDERELADVSEPRVALRSAHHRHHPGDRGPMRFDWMGPANARAFYEALTATSLRCSVVEDSAGARPAQHDIDGCPAA